MIGALQHTRAPSRSPRLAQGLHLRRRAMRSLNSAITMAAWRCRRHQHFLPGRPDGPSSERQVAPHGPSSVGLQGRAGTQAPRLLIGPDGLLEGGQRRGLQATHVPHLENDALTCTLPLGTLFRVLPTPGLPLDLGDHEFAALSNGLAATISAKSRASCHWSTCTATPSSSPALPTIGAATQYTHAGRQVRALSMCGLSFRIPPLVCPCPSFRPGQALLVARPRLPSRSTPDPQP
jgi:hypothetical protein